MINIIQANCPIALYAWAVVQNPRFAAYDLSLSGYVAGLGERVMKDEQYKERMAALTTKIEQTVYLIVVVTFLCMEMSQPGSVKRHEMLKFMVKGKDQEMQKAFDEIAFIINRDPSRTLQDTSHIRHVVVEIVRMIWSVLKPHHRKVEVLTHVFSLVTNPPPPSS